jgi:hypothetical protein
MEVVRGAKVKSGRLLWVIGLAGAAAYLTWARLKGADGFPLDDAWIHQTYARNLGWHGQWAFILGQPSAGSTSPLWTLLLALGYALRLDYALWTHALNAIVLGGLAWSVYRLSGRWWLGVWAALEWHLAWAAASGMETLLFCFLIVAAWMLARSEAGGYRPAALCGLVMGLAVWTRPDGLTLLPFCGLSVWLAANGSWTDRRRYLRVAALTGGATAIVLPYFLFNLALSGQVWPNTFFAKQAEYAGLRQLPLLIRLGQVYSAPLIGSLALLAPGLALAARRWALPLSWAAVYLLAYALRLPVTYQHARYLIPVIPILLAAGGDGMARWVLLQSAVAWRRIASRLWVYGAAAAALAFWLLGASALVADNQWINSEMVATARWVAAEVPAGTLVAAHDIGALGYFADVRLLDLAGLVSPEIIPFIGDDSRVWAFVQRKKASYFITYPGWCPAITQSASLRKVYGLGPACTEQDNLHMAVYAVLP